MINGYLTAWDRTKSNAKWAAGYYAGMKALNERNIARYKKYEHDDKEHYFHWDLTPFKRVQKKVYLHDYNDLLDGLFDLNMGYATLWHNCFAQMDGLIGLDKKDWWTDTYNFLAELCGKDGEDKEVVMKRLKPTLLNIMMPTYKHDLFPLGGTIRKKPDYFWHLPKPEGELIDGALDIYLELADAVEEQNERKKNQSFCELDYRNALADEVRGCLDESKYIDDIIERVKNVGMSVEKKKKKR